MRDKVVVAGPKERQRRRQETHTRNQWYDAKRYAAKN